MASTETLRLLAADTWCDSEQGQANRALPEEVNDLDRATGFTIEYQVKDSGFTPPRTVFNQKAHEWDFGFKHRIVMGIPEHNLGINYKRHAFCQVDGELFVALVANGPALGNQAAPTQEGQAVWRGY